MNTKQLQYVQVLAREASFSRAAEALGISQPSLSQYVKKIEKEIGMPLFDRSATELRLTEAGRLYVAAGRRLWPWNASWKQIFLIWLRPKPVNW